MRSRSSAGRGHRPCAPGQPRLGSLIGKGKRSGAGEIRPGHRALEEAVADPRGRESRRGASLAAAYANLGNVYWSKTDYDEALVYYEKALPLQVAARGEAHPYVGLIHFNMATLHLRKADYDACIASAERALKILVPRPGSGTPRSSRSTTSSARPSQEGRGGPGPRRPREGVAIQLSLPEKGERDSAVIYSSLAEAYRARHDLVRAERTFRKALAIDLSVSAGVTPTWPRTS